jgi:hypothetical protein
LGREVPIFCISGYRYPNNHNDVTMTPIKTPKQMMMEMAGLPHYAGGREVAGKYVSSGVKQLMEEAVKRFTRSAGRAPRPLEMAELEKHAQQFAKPAYTPKTDPVTQARAAHALRVDPNINTEMAPIYARDPFLTQQAFGRGVKGTHISPETLDINDPKVAQMVGEEVGGFRSAGKPETSLTPGAEWMNERSQDVIARQLGGKGDIGGQLKQAFLEKTGRAPSEDEMNALIAAFNPARHNFTGQEIGDVLIQRPKSRVGMPEWRENARATGLPESYTEHRPGGYSQSLKDEMAIASGQVPAAQPEFEREAAKIAKRRNRPAPEPKEVTYDEDGVPHYHYAGGGSISPRDMQADLMVNNRYAEGKQVDSFPPELYSQLVAHDKASTEAERKKSSPGTWAGNWLDENMGPNARHLAGAVTGVGAGALTGLGDIARFRRQLQGKTGSDLSTLASSSKQISEDLSPNAALGGQLAGSFVDPALMALMKARMLTQALGGGALGALKEPEEESSRLANTLIGAAIPPAMTGVAKGLGSGYNYAKSKLGFNK